MPAKSPFVSSKLEKKLRELGLLLRQRRKALGIAAIAVAESTGMSRITLNRIERGEASVTIGAYLSVAEALSLNFRLVDPQVKDATSSEAKVKLPSKIRIASYKQLKKLAWQLKGTQELTPQEALDLYERNWRHVDVAALDAREKKLLQSLLAAFGRERLLV
jgi:transcriptional regulator with XRE-family HTH domain